MIRRTMSIEGMSCDHCRRRVENALNKLPGIRASVDLSAGKAWVEGGDDVGDDRLIEAVQEAGYPVKAIEHQTDEGGRR